MKKYADGGMPKGIQLPEKTQAEIVAERMNKGKDTAQLLKEARESMVEKKMGKTPPMPLPEPGAPRPGIGKSLEDMNMDVDTDRGYEYATKKKAGGVIKKMAKGGSVSSASKRADGCATKGKTKGRML